MTHTHRDGSGTPPFAVIATRRRRNKAARLSRRINRRSR
jgi:hypothetical protein